MKIHRHPTIFLATLLAGIILQTPVPAAQTDIAGPAGSGAFGASVTVLPNGNIVVTVPSSTSLARWLMWGASRC